MSTLTRMSLPPLPAGNDSGRKRQKQVAAQARAQVEALVVSASERPALEVQLATSLGFDTFVALKERSAPIAANDGKHWFKTPIHDGSWAVWNEESLGADRHFATEQEALATVPHDDPLTGSSLLG